MEFKRYKRDLYCIYLIFSYFTNKTKKHYIRCFYICAQIELLESHISYPISKFLFSLLKNKYSVDECAKDDPYLKHVRERYLSSGGRKFLTNNVLVVKKYISPKEKGVIYLKYSENINVFPFIFDLNILQEKYHFVLEQSSESPWQPFNAFYNDKSLVFIQSVSEREMVVHRAHGYIPVPLTSGDWVNKSIFSYDATAKKIYDFCIVSSFIPVKRYPFVLAALKKYWKGDLKFAIVASKHSGESKEWMDGLLRHYGLTDNADIFIEIKQTEVSTILNQSKCLLLASLREGSPKICSEGMLAGNPLVIYKHHIGFPTWKFKAPLVVTYTDAESLIGAIKYAATIDKKEVAELAAKMIGSDRATEILNNSIKEQVQNIGEQWTTDIVEKINKVQSFYKNKADIDQFKSDFENIEHAAFEKGYYNAADAITLFKTADV